jgi:hypothetical protein
VSHPLHLRIYAIMKRRKQRFDEVLHELEQEANALMKT